MKVNGPMIFHHMQKYFHVDYMHASQKNFVKIPILYSRFFNMDEHIVLVTSHDLADCLNRVKNAVVICLDKPETIPACKSNDLLILDDNMADAMSFNILNHVLDQFMEWDSALNHILFKSMSYLDMINTISEMLELPCALCDHDFRYIAYSDNSGEYVQYVDDQNQLTPNDVSALLEQEDFARLENIHEAFYYNVIEPSIIKNVYANGTYVGRIATMIKNAPEDEEYAKAILNHAASYIESLYNMSDSFSNTSVKYKQIHNYLLQILGELPVIPDLFKASLDAVGCHMEDTWQLCCLSSSDDAKSIYSPTYFCTQIEHNWPGHFCIKQADKIYILTDIDLYKRFDLSDIEKDFRQYLEINALNGGQSRSFHDILNFQNIHNACIQAEYALDQVRNLPRKKGFCLFNDVALSYLLEHGRGRFSAELICHPAILTLSKHDKEQGTHFTLTLFTYLHKRYNAVAAAKALFIHRSSFINRMKRIDELCNIDYNNPNDLLYLEMSFALFKNLVKETLLPQ